MGYLPIWSLKISLNYLVIMKYFDLSVGFETGTTSVVLVFLFLAEIVVIAEARGKSHPGFLCVSGARKIQHSPAVFLPLAYLQTQISIIRSKTPRFNFLDVYPPNFWENLLFQCHSNTFYHRKQKAIITTPFF